MFNRVVPKIGRHYRPICLTLRQLKTSPCLSHKSPAWDFIVPTIIRSFKNNQARRHDVWRRPFWQDSDWEQWAARMEKMFDANFTEMGPRKEQHVRFDDSVFEIKIDVQHFAPEEIKVNVSGNKLVVTGNHESKKDDYGVISRKFQREFDIPENVKTKSFESSLSDDGFLTLRADVDGAPKEERTVEIKFE